VLRDIGILLLCVLLLLFNMRYCCLIENALNEFKKTLKELNAKDDQGEKEE
jgi:hypothetical protein